MIHRNVLSVLASSILAATVQSASAKPHSIELTPISSVAAIIPGVSAAEIVAHDPSTQRLFVVNTLAAGDLGPEGLLFIKAEDSPSAEPLLVIANEISGTTRHLALERGISLSH